MEVHHQDRLQHASYETPVDNQFKILKPILMICSYIVIFSSTLSIHNELRITSDTSITIKIYSCIYPIEISNHYIH